MRRTLFMIAACTFPSCAASADVELVREVVKIPGSEVSFEIVRIPGGSASVEGGGEIELRSYWIGSREVTWAEFNLFFETKDLNDIDSVTRPTRTKTYLPQAGYPTKLDRPDLPATNVRWHAAVMYCEWLSRKTGHRYRLPTEAEWMRACGSAGSPDEVAWYVSNSGETTHPGGGKAPNAFGVHDMLGNVWEYCLEMAHPEDFVPFLKGGAWNSPPEELSAGPRKTVPVSWVNGYKPRSTWWLTGGHCQGFRVVRVDSEGSNDERKAYEAKVRVVVEKGEKKKRQWEGETDLFMRVTGEVRNEGDRAVDELEATVFYLTPAGKPHLVDVQGRDKPGAATFGKCYPALVNGSGGSTLRPGETRRFALDIPRSWDGPDDVAKDKFGARVSALILAPGK
jgi:formylglycine-generating enzyme required for sulfatase activity